MESLLLYILGTVQTLAVVAALWYAARQTRHLGRQIEQNTLINVAVDLRELDELVLQNKDLAKLAGENKESMFAAIAVTRFELWFLLHKSNLMDKGWWHSYESLIADKLNQPLLRSYWREHRHRYHPEFAEYLDKKLKKVSVEQRFSR